MHRESRRCPRCGETKTVGQFGKHKSYCRQCWNSYNSDWSRANRKKRNETRRSYEARRRRDDPDYSRGLVLKRYGLTIGDYDRLLTKQNHGCAICRSREPGGKHGTWHIDHDHNCCPRLPKRPSGSCGKCVRGLLCANCNLMIGQAKDNPQRLMAAIEYLGCRVESLRDQADLVVIVGSPAIVDKLRNAA